MSARVRRGALTRRFVVVARLRRALGHGALIGMSAVTTPAPPAERESTGLGLPIVLLGGAQFVMVLDSSVMNVSISLFPLSVTMFIAAMAGPKLAAGIAPKRLAQAGLLAVFVASLVLLGTIDTELNDAEFAIAVSVFGVGAGLLLWQLGNVIMSSVEPAKINEAGGLQGTAQNLGASLGTALIGAVLIAALTSTFVAKVEQNPPCRRLCNANWRRWPRRASP